MSPSWNASDGCTPEVVLVFPERARRLLWEYAFGAAGWRTHLAEEAMDALAVAFNCGANAVITAYGGLGTAVLHEFAKDAELSGLPRCVLLPAGTSLPEALAQDTATFEEPCDPFWLICDLDARIGRVTPAGLGHRPFSDGDLDVAVHHWWWGLAAADLVRQAVRLRRETPDWSTLAERMGGRLGRRIDADVQLLPGGGGPPGGSDLRLLRPGEATPRLIVVTFGEAASPAGRWRITAPEDGLTASHIQCIGALASALDALRTR